MELKEFTEQILSDYRLRLLRALEGMSPEELAWRPNSNANSMAFLFWHVARVEDRWLHRFAQDIQEIWVRDVWSQKTGIAEQGTGVGYTTEQLAQFPLVTGEALQAYFEDVRKETLTFLHSLKQKDFDFAPDREPAPDRPRAISMPAFAGCTLGRMFRQLVAEFNQHLGQIQYVRGLQKGLDDTLNAALV
jgi:hypothetical protein